ncbi:MAG: [FeFe] hydrogenase H-cluster maturation GTPase HydF [Lachnospiraceae bacterium]|nr:[FeFe] hydrogenase H-cluster maturation GTPase HydF [Lachnospiraceae bacterium]
MGLQTTMYGDRLQIVLLGKTNAGKSSLINEITGQPLAIVSDTKGTTTDPVSKAMEILPVGPCLLTDTPGLDDEGELGRKRVEKTKEVLRRADVAVLVVNIAQLAEEEEFSGQLPRLEQDMLTWLEERKVPAIIVLHQADQLPVQEAEQIRHQTQGKYPGHAVVLTSVVKKQGIEELKDQLVAAAPQKDDELHIVSDLVRTGDMVVLVVPIDSAAPKGRLIMPQQQTIRDLLDHHAIPIVTQVEELAGVLSALADKVKLVITDSQAFKEVNQIVPADIPLTSFSILFARHKGNLQQLMEGVRMVEQLRDGDKVLIAEGCTHRRQCDDIGTVKIPNWLRTHTGCKLDIETCSGSSFPADLSPYAMVIHCGGCTLHEKEMKHRIFMAKEQKVPIVNYGIFIAYINGIVQRSTELFRDK